MGSHNQYFSVFVSHLPNEMEKGDLRDAFNHCGTVKDIFISRSSKDDQPWTYGFVRFADLKGAVKATKDMNGWRIKDKRIVVELAKSIDKSAIESASSETKKKTPLPSVNPCIEAPDPQDSNFLIDKVVNLNRLQDICSMLNYESCQNSDSVYVDKIFRLIEEKKCSSKIQASEIKLRKCEFFSDAGRLYTNGLESSASEEFTKKYRDVRQSTQRLLSTEPTSKKPTGKNVNSLQSGSPSSRRNSSSSPRKSSAKSSPENLADVLSQQSNISLRSSREEKGFSPDGSPPSNEAEILQGISVGKKVKSRDIDMKTVEQIQSHETNTFLKDATHSLSENSTVCHSTLSSSKLFGLSMSNLKAADPLPCIKKRDQSDEENSPRSYTSHGAQKDEKFLPIAGEKNTTISSEEPWEEKKTTQRKKRSEWVSELFFQILSDSPESATSADEKSSKMLKSYKTASISPVF